jgi:hypothetical protein
MLPHEAMRGLAAALADVEEGRVNRAVALIFAEGGGSMLPLGAYHALVGEGEERRRARRERRGGEEGEEGEEGG